MEDEAENWWISEGVGNGEIGHNTLDGDQIKDNAYNHAWAKLASAFWGGNVRKSKERKKKRKGNGSSAYSPSAGQMSPSIYKYIIQSQFSKSYLSYAHLFF